MIRTFIAFGLFVALASGCKPRTEADSSLRDAQLSKLSSRNSCAVYQEGETVYATRCPKAGDNVAPTTKPAGISNQQWEVLKKAQTMTRLQCPATQGNVLGQMSAKAYEEELGKQLAISNMTTVMANLKDKKATLEEIKKNVEIIRKLQQSDSNTNYETEAKALDEQLSAVSLQIAEYEAYIMTKAGSVKIAEKIMGLLKPDSNEVFYYPNDMVAAILGPLLKDKVDSCFDGPAQAVPQTTPVAQPQPRVDPDLVTQCKQVGPNWFPFNSDGKQIGSVLNEHWTISEASCKKVLTVQKNGVMCSKGRTQWAVHRIKDARRISGNDLGFGIRDLDSCLTAVTSYSNGTYVCGGNGVGSVSAYVIATGTVAETWRDDDAWKKCQVYIRTYGVENIPGNINSGNSGHTNTGSSGNSGNTNTGNSGNSGNSGTQPLPTGSVTANPESLQENSVLAAADVIAALKEADSHFKVDQGTKSSCLGVTPPTWSDVMAHFYCQFPITVGNNQYSVRACFTGSVQGRSPYAKIDDYRKAYEFCIGRQEFEWINQKASRKTMFQYIMMSQRNLSAGQWRFSQSSQNAALSSFYGGSIPKRK